MIEFIKTFNCHAPVLTLKHVNEVYIEPGLEGCFNLYKSNNLVVNVGLW